ncbi:MAG: DNA polymerase III subunit epsilon [Gammaproteobacteria bacterium]|nr:DNA polymerase III subunit epsilon [Gammaproteobacteria bacterium]
MRPMDWRQIMMVSAVGVVCLGWLLVAGVLLRAVLGEADWQAMMALLGGRIGLLAMLWALALIPVSLLIGHLLEHYVRAPARLAMALRSALHAGVHRPVVPDGSRETRELAELVNALVAEREAMHRDMDARVREASRATELERNRLAALMSELGRSVIVCNLDGRILLYNQRARLQFRRLSRAAGWMGGAELIGLGRSIYTVLDRELVAHALENVQRRLARGAEAPSAQFVTPIASGGLLRVQMAPVQTDPESLEGDPEAVAEGSGERGHALAGFVLLLENVTEQQRADAEEDRLVARLVADGRHLASRARDVLSEPSLAVGEAIPQVGNTTEVRVLLAGFEARLEQFSRERAALLPARWSLDDMLGSELLEMLEQNIVDRLALAVSRIDCSTSPWLRVESYSFMQTVLHLVKRVHRDCGAGALQIGLVSDAPGAALELRWNSDSAPTPRLVGDWMASSVAGNGESGLSVAQVLARHGGSLELLEPTGGSVGVRLPLRLAPPQEELPQETWLRGDSRPEYYDFDLFHASARVSSLEDSRLEDLVFTVFDTETTGLDPAGGDQILQLGAVRIVNGRVLPHESFEQLVDPKRAIPAAGIAIHGITPEMVRDQPGIETVLPAFHAFCEGTVLVAHNAAFDMRCLQLAESRAGVQFDHPVLDTLLLSAVLSPEETSHRLESIAERLGLPIIGRHTAMGDALVTAEIFVRLLRLLADRGINTLAQARVASRNTYLARLRY